MPDAHPEFRLGSVLATSFTATLTERQGDSVERIPTARRLADWLVVSGLGVTSCSGSQLERARELREAIHLCASAAAVGHDLPVKAVAVINEFSSQGQASAGLTLGGQREWRLRATFGVDDALGVIAADAIDIISGERDGRLALCASPSCQAAFFDTSQSRTRRWCEMNTCGNRQKKARRKAGKAVAKQPLRATD